MNVSVVVNTYNRVETLPTALDGIQRLRYPFIEIIVVNGPSTDGTDEYIQNQWAGKVKLLTCSEPNLSKSRNIGILAAAGDIVAFIDDDAVPEADWIDNIVPFYKDPQVAAVGGFVRNNSGVTFQATYIHSRRDGFSNCQANGPLPDSTGNSFNGMIGVNSTFRKKMLIEVGGFDEEYAYFLDETDVCARLSERGYKIKISPEAEVHHKFAASHIRSEKGTPKTWQQIAKSTAYYCITNKSADEPLGGAIENIWKNYYQCLTSTSRARSGGAQGIDIARLYAELRTATGQGIFDALSQKSRKLIGLDDRNGAEWLAISRLSSGKGRLFRLAFVTDVYPPLPCGGVAVFIKTLAQRLAAEGHEITIITFAAPGRPHTVDFEDGVWVHRMSPESGFREIAVPSMPDHPLRASQIILAELERINARRRFEWVIGAIWDLPLAAAIASGQYKIATYLVTSYALMADSKPEWHSNRHYYENHVLKMIATERWAIEHSDLVFASTKAISTDSEAAYGIRIPKTRLATVPFGVKDHSCKEVRRTRAVKLLFVGRFERRKGIHLLLEIIPKVLEEFEDVEIDLVGDNNIPQADGKLPWKDFLEKYSGNTWLSRIAAPGVVSDEELERHYHNCDVFVAPSLYESFGLIYLEAMRHGKPCIGSNAGGISEVVTHGETGILIEAGSSTSLLAGIRRLLSSTSARQEMGMRGRRKYEEKFTVDAFAERFVEALINHERQSPRGGAQ